MSDDPDRVGNQMPYLRACFSGLIGYLFPRILHGFGVPLDIWAAALGRWARLVMTPEQALLVLCFLSAVIGLMIGAYWPIIRGRLSVWAAASAPVSIPEIKGIDAMSDKPKNVFHIGDHNQVSNVHVGDVNRLQEPELKVSHISRETQAGGTIKNRFALNIPHPVARVTFQIQSEGIIRCSISGIRHDVYQQYNDKLWQENWGPAHGQHEFYVVTRADVPIKFAHGFG